MYIHIVTLLIICRCYVSCVYSYVIREFLVILTSVLFIYITCPCDGSLGKKNPISINNAKLANSRKHYNELRRMLPRSWVSFTVPLEQEQLSVNSEECPLQRRFCPFLQYFYLFFFVRARWPLPTLPSSTSDSF